MTKTEIKRFRTLLGARQAEFGRANGDRESLAIDTSPDELDRIQNATVRDLAIESLQRESSRLRDVQAALRRIDTGTFGTCLDCEEEIDLKRLAAVPWTRFCIECQETTEKEGKQPTGTFAQAILSEA